MKTQRELAMEWWNYLRNTHINHWAIIGGTKTKDKGHYTEKYYPHRMWQYLTDKEIEVIFENEIKNKF